MPGPFSKIAIVTVLSGFVLTGSLTFLPAAAWRDIERANGQWAIVWIVLSSGVILLGSHYIAVRCARKVCRMPPEWSLFGINQALWRILIPIAYGLGVVCGLIVSFEI
jgi:hypothetical protein